MLLAELVQSVSILVTTTLYMSPHHVDRLAYVNACVKDQGMGTLRDLQYLSEQPVFKGDMLCTISFYVKKEGTPSIFI